MPLAPNALTTYDAVKSYIRAADDSNKSDLERLINWASGWIETQTGRKFGKSVFTDKYFGPRNGRTLLLKQYPVLSVTSVVIDETDIDLNEVDVENESGILHRHKGWKAERSTTIIYEAGYVLPAQETTGPPAVVRTLPYDLEDACIQIVAVRNDMRGSEHLKSERIDVLSSDFLDSLPLSARETLANYRKVR